MTTLFILRQEPEAAERLRVWLSLVPDFQVVGATSSLMRTRQMLPQANPDVLVTDLRLADGPVESLLSTLRDGGRLRRPKVLLLSHCDDDALLLSTLRAGGDSFFVEGRPGATMERAIASIAQGEAAMSPWIARQVLDHFDLLAARDSADPIAAAQNPLHLTPFERITVTLLAQGWLVDEIARHQSASVHSVATRVHAVYRKLQFDVRAGDLTLAA